MADKSLYRITYDNGRVKLANRGILGSVLGAHKIHPRWSKHPVKVERAPEPFYEDVTGEFLKEDGA